MRLEFAIVCIIAHTSQALKQEWIHMEIDGRAALPEMRKVQRQYPPQLRHVDRMDELRSSQCMISKKLLQFEHEATTSAFEEAYALKPEVLKAGRLEVVNVSVKRLARAFSAAENFRVVVLGGSFTRGHGCSLYGERELDCSWPRRVERWWRKAIPNASLIWENRAEHGRSSRELLAGLSANLMDSAKLPDLVIIDLLVNDADAPSDTWIAHEALLRALQEMLPKAQLLLVFGASPSCIRVADRYRELARHYRIPAIDYAMMVARYNKAQGESGPDTLWPNTSPPLDAELHTFTVMGSPWPDFAPAVNVTSSTCCPQNHPPWPVHQYVADAVVDTLRSLLAKSACESEAEHLDRQPMSLPSALAEDTQLERFPVCLKPLTQYSAFSNGLIRQTLEPELISGNWQFFEDRPGRPGWIATSKGSRIRFPVRFGIEPTLTISFLRSYRDVGRAKISIKSQNESLHSMEVTGKWDQSFSLPMPLFFVARPDAQNGDLISDLLSQRDKERLRERGGNIERMLEIETLDNEKFKVVGVTTC